MIEGIEDAGRHVAHELERYLGALSTIAAISPLLGLLGTVTGNHADGSFNGETDDDRFYGVRHAGGISAIEISSSSSTGLEVDHLQYGLLAAGPWGLLSAYPTPSSSRRSSSIPR